MTKYSNEFRFIGHPTKVWKDRYDVTNMVQDFLECHEQKPIEINIKVLEE